MSYTVKGTIKEILKVESGVSKSDKEWKKLTFAISNNDGYEGKEVVHAFEIFGIDKVDNFLKYNKVGALVEVSFNSSSNRWVSPKGDVKYFTTNQAWKIFGATTETPQEIATEEGDDDLPF